MIFTFWFFGYSCLIYIYITDRRTDRQTHQKYSSKPHKINFFNLCYFYANFMLIYVKIIKINQKILIYVNFMLILC